MMQRKGARASLPLLAFLAGAVGAAGQMLRITNDAGTTVTGTPRVNVGEHITLRVAVSPAGTSLSNIRWTVAGVHLKDWLVKDATQAPMAPADLQGATITFLWKDPTATGAANAVTVTARAGASDKTATAQFEVVRGPKPEKYYSDDFLMEYHNNWHSVWMFSSPTARRGDLFLAWHRSQLEYFNAWRSFFGYAPVPLWDPVTAWATGATVPPEKQHPSTAPAPAAAFSRRPSSLITLDLAAQGLTTSSLGQYDLVTQSRNRGTTPEFVSVGYILRSETVRQILSIPSTDSRFSRVGSASIPSWWQPNTGQTATDPWFAGGCPLGPQGAPQSCSPQTKRSFADYTLRELGESVESGWYASNFQVNYHALGHIVGSGDMANPVTSMRDPIFWGWHRAIDKILTDWQMTKGPAAQGLVAVSGTPTFSPDWKRLRVTFSQAIVPELLRAQNVTVNGSSATSATDITTGGKGLVFEFTGFAVPPSGPVEAVVRREANNDIRTVATAPRPVPTLIMSSFGNLLTPTLNRFTYTRP
jgi:hypothetical protein